MDDFIKYFEDENFVRWVLNPDDEINNYWQDYFTKHPGIRAEADKARVLLSQLISKEVEKDSRMAAEIYSGILKNLSNNHQKPNKKRWMLSFLKYAAIIVLCLSLGGVLVYQYLNKDIQVVYDLSENIPDTGEAKLILSDGQVIQLTQKESTVEHSDEGKIIINRQDTLVRSAGKSSDDMNQLIMPYGMNSSVLLPDGTRAYLNAGSRLVYPSVFKGRTREVMLIGEAFFEVAHNPRLPFVVKTSEMNVVATGTQFNVSAYSTDRFIEIALIEGKVHLSENSMKLLKREMELNPGEAVSINRESFEASVFKIDVNDYITWHLGYLNFQGTDLNRIVARLERYYNIKVYLDNPMLGMRKITGKLVLREERQKVLEALASSARLELFTINENSYGLK